MTKARVALSSGSLDLLQTCVTEAAIATMAGMAQRWNCAIDAGLDNGSLHLFTLANQTAKRRCHAAGGLP